MKTMEQQKKTIIETSFPAIDGILKSKITWQRPEYMIE